MSFGLAPDAHDSPRFSYSLPLRPLFPRAPPPPPPPPERRKVVSKHSSPNSHTARTHTHARTHSSSSPHTTQETRRVDVHFFLGVRQSSSCSLLLLRSIGCTCQPACLHCHVPHPYHPLRRSLSCQRQLSMQFNKEGQNPFFSVTHLPILQRKNAVDPGTPDCLSRCFLPALPTPYLSPPQSFPFLSASRSPFPPCHPPPPVLVLGCAFTFVITKVCRKDASAQGVEQKGAAQLHVCRGMYRHPFTHLPLPPRLHRPLTKSAIPLVSCNIVSDRF